MLAARSPTFCVRKEAVALVVQVLSRSTLVVGLDVRGRSLALPQGWEADIVVCPQDLATIAITGLKPHARSRRDVGVHVRGSNEHGETGLALRSTSEAGVPIAADRALEKIAKHVAGRLEPEGQTEEGYDILVGKYPIRRSGFDLTYLAVRSGSERLVEVVDQEGIEAVLSRIQSERNETTAKVLVAALSYAMSAASTIDRSRFVVDLHDLVNLVSGYQRSGPVKTQRTRYHTKVAEVLRVLFVDLANTQVSIRVVRPRGTGGNTIEFMGEYLMNRPRLIAERDFQYGRLAGEVRRLAAEGNSAALEAIAYLRRIRPTAIEIGFPDRILAALGVGSGNTEFTNRDVLKLKGSYWWLAFDLALRTRWTRKSKKNPMGTPLVGLLWEHGFIEESRLRTSGRTSYKVALQRFFGAIDELLDLGALDEPGARIVRHHGGPGREADVTREVRGWLNQRGRRITTESLRPLNVRFELRKDRVQELHNSRRQRRARSRG